MIAIGDYSFNVFKIQQVGADEMLVHESYGFDLGAKVGKKQSAESIAHSAESIAHSAESREHSAESIAQSLGK